MFYAWIGFIVIAAVVAKIIFHKHIKIFEMALVIAVPAIITTIIWYSGRYSEASSVEILSGEVLKKDAITKKCPSGWVRSTDSFCTEYSTREVKDGETCSTDSNGRRTCTPNYVTEYNYDYPWERRYFVNTNIGEYEIDREDRQGVTYPQRYNNTNIGEPVAKKHQYTNWIKAVPESLFFKKLANSSYIVPQYPTIYDLWRIDRVVDDKFNLPSNIKELLNENIANGQKIIGPKKQGNIILVFTAGSMSRADEIISEWNGGEKNDILIFIGGSVDKFEWVKVFSWSKFDIVNVTLREEILGIGGLTPELSNVILTTVEKHYERKPMAEFEYLKENIEPPTWVVVLCSLVSIGITIGMLIWSFKNEY